MSRCMKIRTTEVTPDSSSRVSDPYNHPNGVARALKPQVVDDCYWH